MVGSLAYTNATQLSDAEADKIRFYFNYDMIGSIKPRYGVYQGSQDADMFGAKPLAEYLNSTGKAAYYGCVPNPVPGNIPC